MGPPERCEGSLAGVTLVTFRRRARGRFGGRQTDLTWTVFGLRVTYVNILFDIEHLATDPVLKPTLQKTRSGLTYLARRRDGPSVVVLHGIGSNAASFLPVLDHVPDHLDLIFWNAPGYQGSKPVADPWPLPEDYADVLGRFLDDLKLSSVHLVGHSLGTLIAGAFARKYPERVEALVLVSAANGYGVPKGAVLPDRVRARIEDLARLGPMEFAKARAGNLVHDPARHAPVVSMVEAAMAEVDPAGYGQAVHLLASGDLARDLAHVPVCPGFILGAEDRITPMEQTKGAADAWEAANGVCPPLRVIDAAGHAVYLQRTEEFSAALIQLLPDGLASETRQTHHREET